MLQFRQALAGGDSPWQYALAGGDSSVHRRASVTSSGSDAVGGRLRGQSCEQTQQYSPPRPVCLSAQLRSSTRTDHAYCKDINQGFWSSEL